jgi:hypothetical protein
MIQMNFWMEYVKHGYVRTAIGQVRTTSKGSEIMDESGDVKEVICHCYFRGRDGLGTCNIY